MIKKDNKLNNTELVSELISESISESVSKSISESINKINLEEIINRLDYSITEVNKRKELIDNILSDPILSIYLIDNPMLLEKFSNYILYCKENLVYNDNSDYPFMTNNKIHKNKKKEVLSGDSGEAKRKQMDVENVYTEQQVKLKVTNDDRAKFPCLMQTGETIFKIKSIIEKKCHILSNIEISKLKKIIIEMQKEEVLIKEILTKPIYFKKLEKNNSKICFDSDTGYFDENGDYKLVSCNTINFKNPLHIHKLIELYTLLFKNSYDKCNSDTKYMLISLDEVIENTKISDCYKDILIMKIDGLFADEIISYIFEKYGIVLSPDRLSKIYKQNIPKKIANTYNEMYNDWYYTFKAKGKYKMCPRCGENKLFSKFGKDDTRVDKLRGYCKECEIEIKKIF